MQDGMTSEGQRLIAEAGAALQRRDGHLARARLDEAAQIVAPSDFPWMLLARASRLQGDAAAEQAALASQLQRDPRDLPALLAMADCNIQAGDDRAATSWFQTALNVANAFGAPPQLQPLLHRASEFLAQSSARYEAHLLKSLGDAGTGKPPRVAQALDLLLGKAQLYHQQPSSFYFPGLPQRQFFEREEFDWVDALEARTPALQAELAAIRNESGEFAPYVETPKDRPAPANPLRDDPSWGALYVWRAGEQVTANATRAPETMAALARVPMPRIRQRSPMALYSLLKPGTHIQPHHGLLNTRLICHLPLVAPPDCALRVGNETRAWREGKMLIFDDSIEHEAWNRSETTRIILLFEIWRPELGDDERAALTTLFEAISDYSGVTPEDTG